MRLDREAFLKLAAVAEPADCWLWNGVRSPEGYGKFRNTTAHRAAWVIFVGPVSSGLVIDHLCRVRACVNPLHLEPVTPAENVRRYSRLVTECASGHGYTPENTYIRPNGQQRDCRACVRDRRRRYVERKRCAA